MDFASFPKGDASRIVYVRTVKIEDLPKALRAETGDLTQVFAIHDEGGAVLGLVDTREHAFQVARMNEMAPVSVH